MNSLKKKFGKFAVSNEKAKKISGGNSTRPTYGFTQSWICTYTDEEILHMIH